MTRAPAYQTRCPLGATHLHADRYPFKRMRHSNFPIPTPPPFPSGPFSYTRTRAKLLSQHSLTHIHTPVFYNTACTPVLHATVVTCTDSSGSTPVTCAGGFYVNGNECTGVYYLPHPPPLPPLLLVFSPILSPRRQTERKLRRKKRLEGRASTVNKNHVFTILYLPSVFSSVHCVTPST